MELARAYDEFLADGAEVAAVSTDPVGAGAGLTEKLGLPFPLLSDPGGETAIRPFGVWDEREGLARIAAVAIAPDGLELFRFEGVDYADRPRTEDILDAVRPLGLIPRAPTAGAHPHGPPEPSADSETRHELAVYMRGVRSASKVLYERNGDEGAWRVWDTAKRYYELLSASELESE